MGSRVPCSFRHVQFSPERPVQAFYHFQVQVSENRNKRTGRSIWSILKAKKTVFSCPSIRAKAGLGIWLCPLSGLRSAIAPARHDLTCGVRPEPLFPSCSPARAELRCSRSSTSGRIREIRLSCRRTTPLFSLTLQTRSEKETTPFIFLSLPSSTAARSVFFRPPS
jgi:hypothetical protein